MNIDFPRLFRGKQGACRGAIKNHLELCEYEK